jgi:hypothetical protein
MKKGIIIITIGILGIIGSKTQAGLIEIVIEAEVTAVSDSGNLLEGNVNVGDTITGSYKYDSETPDNNPTDTSLGNYWLRSSPYGIFLTVGGLEFKTDLDSVKFDILIANNDISSSRDIYGLTSYNNTFLENNTPVDIISWDLNDYTETAIDNDLLPITAPIVNDWQSVNILLISGGEERGIRFGIGANVTSAVLVPEPSTLILITLGLGLLKERGNKYSCNLEHNMRQY